MPCCKARSHFYFLVLIVLLSASYSHAQRISGKVINEKNETLPFVNVFVEGTSNGTTTNMDGNFILDLSGSGTYRIVFRYIGYKTHIETLVIQNSSPSPLLIKLTAQAIEIKEYTLSAKEEDPAYPIIRKAQKKRKFYQTQVDRYSCHNYIKGMTYLRNLPDKIMGRDIVIEGLDSTRSGIVYLSESVSNYFFQQPDKRKEVMISSKVSGQSQGFSWNSALDFQLDFYSNTIATPVTDRDIISPIAADAMTYYKYRLLDDYNDNGVTVYRIEVIPKVTGSPLLNGIIHIQDQTWRIHAFDMYLTKNNGMNFLDTLRLNVIYIPLNEEVWMKGTQHLSFNFDIKLFGLKGDGTFTGVFSDYQINPTFPPRFFSGEVVRIEEESNQKNEAYWDSIRPVPLTQTEQNDYQLKDSIEIIRESKTYKDSVDRKQNRFKPLALISGYTWRNSWKQIELTFSSPIMHFHFNTVEGINLTQEIEFVKSYKKKNARLRVYAVGRYGFSGKRFYYKAGVRHRFSAINRLFVAAEGGRYISQYNTANPITDLQNSFYTIFFEENFIKIFEKYYGRAAWGMEVHNGIYFESHLEYAWRRPLINAPTLTKFYVDWDSRGFSSNHPLEPLTPNAPITPHHAFVFNFKAKFTFGQKYMMRPNRKLNYESKYPVITLQYQRGIPITQQSPDYDFLQINVEQEINTGIMGTTEYSATYGMFLSKHHLTFIDYHHFNTTQTVFTHRDELNSFRTLPYYRFSTDKLFAELHAQHHFKGWFLGKIPGIKKLKWHEVIGFHFLYTPELKDYYEFTIGLENIFRFIRADFAAGFIRDESPVFTGRIRIRL